MQMIYTTSDPKFVGKIPVRTEIEVLPADEIPAPVLITSDGEVKSNKPIGFTVTEEIGVAVINPRGLLRAKIVMDKNNE